MATIEHFTGTFGVIAEIAVVSILLRTIKIFQILFQTIRVLGSARAEAGTVKRRTGRVAYRTALGSCRIHKTRKTTSVVEFCGSSPEQSREQSREQFNGLETEPLG